MRHVFTHNDGVIDDKFVSKVPGSSASALESLSRCVVWPSRTDARSVPLSPVSWAQGAPPSWVLPKAGILAVDLILGAGQLDRTVSGADVLLGQYPAEDGLRYLTWQPSTDPNHLSPEDLAVTILIAAAADEFSQICGGELWVPWPGPRAAGRPTSSRSSAPKRTRVVPAAKAGRTFSGEDI